MADPISDPIKVNLHGHGLPDYGHKWKRACGYDPYANVAEIIFDRCVAAGIGIYTLTNEPEFPGYREKSRYLSVNDFAKELESGGRYERTPLDTSAFHLRRKKDDKELIFLRGQSLRVTDVIPRRKDKREYELLTVGRDDMGNFDSFDAAFNYLRAQGLPAIGEHPLAYGHHGPIERERLELFLETKLLTAVEWNGKLGMTNWSWLFPPIFTGWNNGLREKVDQVRGARRSRNTELETLAIKFRTPMIANDDADLPEQIGIASTTFERSAIRMETSGSEIVEDIYRLIRDGWFKANKGDIGTLGFLRYGHKIATV